MGKGQGGFYEFKRRGFKVVFGGCFYFGVAGGDEREVGILPQCEGGEASRNFLGLPVPRRGHDDQARRLLGDHVLKKLVQALRQPVMKPASEVVGLSVGDEVNQPSLRQGFGEVAGLVRELPHCLCLPSSNKDAAS